MKKFALFLFALMMAAGCGGPLYSRIDDNIDYWGFADARGQAQAIAIKRMAESQGIKDKKENGDSLSRTEVAPIRPISERNAPGIITNRSGRDKRIKIIGPDYEKNILVESRGVITEKLSKNEIYLYTVEDTNGQIYGGASLNPLPVDDRMHTIQFKGKTFDVNWWINIP